MISSLNVLYITITIHLPDISIQTKTTNYAVKREATSPYYTVFSICFSNFPRHLHFLHSTLHYKLVDHVTTITWRTLLYSILWISLGAPILMYVLITFFSKIVSILNRYWNLRQVVNFEYKLCSVSRQILIVRMKYKIVFSNQI